MAAEVLQLPYKTQPSAKIVERIQQAIGTGEIVVFPAETSYSIGGDAFQAKVVQRLQGLRREDKPLALYIGSMTELRLYTVPLLPRLRRALERLLPGPSVVVLRATPAAPRAAVGRHAEIEVHYHSSRSYQIFYEAAGRPLVGFSLSLWDPQEILHQFSEKSDVIVLTEEPLKREQMALIDFTQDPPVARQGELPKGLL
ncbi:MAG: Sua5/YciO/YrdC/YwlC family protein [Candidatus Bipolaricaulota bacterium]|nr:Sua5/YciO/YrdC/YwlC family protein [Candidatus Bipolaricaulota bacterium]MCS7275220.1 Sua5/YciO/YrdC/YwlC family protein [Candidatus Bipolaricaulota bacterium]MDW8110305.1 Sua5/YciO/YrdC/YwlC family protein [Candidatus Bipolaricaulota bacterium]MDW8328799.1 Sua5/YciO/YrdC/YwlC family protein [Candidatus Bipolaricaulota bacterium]